MKFDEIILLYYKNYNYEHDIYLNLKIRFLKF